MLKYGKKTTGLSLQNESKKHPSKGVFCSIWSKNLSSTEYNAKKVSMRCRRARTLCGSFGIGNYSRHLHATLFADASHGID